jgi:hypothetical protein
MSHSHRDCLLDLSRAQGPFPPSVPPPPTPPPTPKGFKVGRDDLARAHMGNTTPATPRDITLPPPPPPPPPLPPTPAPSLFSNGGRGLSLIDAPSGALI